MLYAHHAQVGDGKGPVLQVPGRQVEAFGPLLQLDQLFPDGGQSLPVGLVHHRDHQPMRRGYGDTDIHLFPVDDVAIVPLGVDLMVAIARALVARPSLLLMDEPSAALAPVVVSAIYERIQAVAKEGTAILLVEQNVRVALPISHRAYALELGRNVLEGLGPELLNDPRIGRLYLGAGAHGKEVDGDAGH